ncbi:MAG: DUF2252 family protein [Pseudomonadota bacterium]
MDRRAQITEELSRIDGHAPGNGLNKHKKMCLSPFVFYRGSAQLFYADLASGKLALPKQKHIPLTTIMGDCHTSNFGFFTEEGSFDEQLVFSINDFDDACIGNGAWDIMRLLVSICLVEKHCKGVVSGAFHSEKDYSEKPVISTRDVASALDALLEGYCNVLEQGLTEHKNTSSHSLPAEMPSFLDASFSDFESPSPLKKRYKKALQIIRGGKRFEQKSSLAKAADLSSFPLKFKVDDSKYVQLNDGLEIHLNAQLAPYFYHDILDIVGRVGAGTGSVNMNRYYAIVGPKHSVAEDALDHSYIVEIKQQREAAPLYHFTNMHPQNKLDSAHLTVKCQRRMQRRSDYVLDHAMMDGKHWLIRSRHHAKVGIDPEHIGIGEINTDESGFVFYANACGQELARAHCRADRYTWDYEKNMLGYLTEHADALMETAQEYAHQVEQDWLFLKSAEGL